MLGQRGPSRPCASVYPVYARWGGAVPARGPAGCGCLSVGPVARPVLRRRAPRRGRPDNLACPELVEGSGRCGRVVLPCPRDRITAPPPRPDRIVGPTGQRGVAEGLRASAASAPALLRPRHPRRTRRPDNPVGPRWPRGVGVAYVLARASSSPLRLTLSTAHWLPVGQTILSVLRAEAGPSSPWTRACDLLPPTPTAPL